MDGRPHSEIRNSLLQMKEKAFFVCFLSIHCSHCNFQYSHTLFLQPIGSEVQKYREKKCQKNKYRPQCALFQPASFHPRTWHHRMAAPSTCVASPAGMSRPRNGLAVEVAVAHHWAMTPQDGTVTSYLNAVMVRSKFFYVLFVTSDEDLHLWRGNQLSLCAWWLNWGLALCACFHSSCLSNMWWRIALRRRQLTYCHDARDEWWWWLWFIKCRCVHIAVFLCICKVRRTAGKQNTTLLEDAKKPTTNKQTKTTKENVWFAI